MCPLCRLRSDSLTALVGLIVAVAGGCTSSAEDKATLPRAAEHTAPAAVTVDETQVKRLAVTVPVEATGTTEPLRASDLAPQITARVAAVLVSEGQRVKAGARLIRLDVQEAQLRAAEARARAASTAAQAQQVASDVVRLTPLAERGTIPQQRLEQLVSQRKALEAAVQAANAAAEQAESDAQQAVVRAPFAGVVSTIAVEAGEMATKTPSTKLLRLVDLSQLEVRIQLHERDLARIALGDRAVITIPSVDRTLYGTVSYVRPEIDPRTRTAEVVIRIPNRDGTLLAGMFTTVQIEPASKRNALVIPHAAVGMTGDDRFVYVIAGGQVHRRVVETRPIDDALLEVVDGLREGERIVASDIQQLADGVRVSRQRQQPSNPSQVDPRPSTEEAAKRAALEPTTADEEAAR